MVDTWEDIQKRNPGKVMKGRRSGEKTIAREYSKRLQEGKATKEETSKRGNLKRTTHSGKNAIKDHICTRRGFQGLFWSLDDKDADQPQSDHRPIIPFTFLPFEGIYSGLCDHICAYSSLIQVRSLKNPSLKLTWRIN